MKARVLDLFLIAVFVAVATWIYRGFYFPDPFYFEGGSSRGLRLMLTAVRIVFPIVILGIIAVFLAVRTGRLSGLGVGIGIFGLLASLVIGYIPVSHFYYNGSSANRLDRYHPYLQLEPPTLELRDASIDEPPYRVFFIGGSTTAWPDSHGVGWPVNVEKQLVEALPGRTVQTYNAAQEWYTSQHAVINYAVNVRKFHPDVIVVMHAINDLMVNADFSWISAGAFREDYRHFYGPVTRLVKRQSLFAMLSEKFHAAWYYQPRERVVTDVFPGLVPFERNIKTLIDLARVDGTKVVLMTEPSLYRTDLTADERAHLTMLNYTSVGPRKQWELASVLSGMNQYNATLGRIAAEKGTAFIDLDKLTPKTLDIIRDDVHYTDKGYELIADTVSKELAPILKSFLNRDTTKR